MGTFSETMAMGLIPRTCLGAKIIILSVGHNPLICKSESIIVRGDLASYSNPPNIAAD